MADSAALYIVPTPIGNLDDISKRAADTLHSVEWIAAEDTRHSQRLLQHLGVKAKMLSLHEHNEDKRTAMLCHRLKSGESVALISDAGTPLISDPGYVLVKACREEGIAVIALPGPCAAITALSASGLPTDRFIFEGFLPPKSLSRQNVLAGLVNRTATSVFYESPRRILHTVNDIETVLGPDRTLVLAKELTKTFERYIYGTATDLIEWLTEEPAHQKGEFVIMVGPAESEKSDIPEDALGLLKILMKELPLKKAAAMVAEHYQLKKNALYQAGLALTDK